MSDTDRLRAKLDELRSDRDALLTPDRPGGRFRKPYLNRMNKISAIDAQISAITAVLGDA